MYHLPAQIQFPPTPHRQYVPTMPPAPPMIHNNPAIPMPPPPPPPTHATQPYQPMQQQNYYNNTGNRSSRRGYGSGGYGRGRGRRNNTSGQQKNPPHPVQRHNNWCYCYSCGFDTPHEGHSCDKRNTSHMPTLTREMKIADMNRPIEQQQYCNASHAGHHKRFLPSQAAINRYPQYQRDM